MDSNVSGNHVYYSACSLPVVLKNLYSKLHCQKVFFKKYKICYGLLVAARVHANPRLKRVWEGDPTIDEARPSPSFQPDPSASPPPAGSPARMCDINQLVDRRVLDGSEDLPEAPQQDVRMDEVLTPSQKCSVCYRGTSLIKKHPLPSTRLYLGSYGGP